VILAVAALAALLSGVGLAVWYFLTVKKPGTGNPKQPQVTQPT
jgi:hypothetical protein